MRGRQRKPPECYAGVTDERGKWNWRVEPIVGNLEKPLHVHKPTTWAIWNDLFHEAIPDDFIAAAFGVMAACPQHVFVVLTKRAKRMAKWTNALWDRGNPQSETVAQAQLHGIDVSRWPKTRVAGFPFPNVILMVTAEDQPAADERIPLLLQTPAAVRGVSYEPALSAVDFTEYLWSMQCVLRLDGVAIDRRAPNQPRLDLVIAGGESGSKARPMLSDWARSARDQCMKARVSFFFKQYGEWVDPSHPLFGKLPERPICQVDPSGMVLDPPPQNEDADCITMKRVGKKAAGRELDGRVWDQMPEGCDREWGDTSESCFMGPRKEEG